MRFFDHNATTPLLAEAREVWLEASDSAWLNPSSPYRSGAAVHARLEDARQRLADMFSVGPGRIIFNSGATEGNNAVFAFWAQHYGGNSRVGVSPTEHPSVLEAAKHFFGERVVWLPLDENGVVDLARADLSELDAVCVMAANNETGLLNPWMEFAKACRDSGKMFHCDASQWIGKMPLEGFEACDFVTGCAHKFGGPKGVGFLVAPEGTEMGLLGGQQENRRRAGTEDVAGIVSMVKALEVTESKRAQCSARAKQAFVEGLEKRLPDLLCVGGGASSLWNTLSVVMPEFGSSRWIRALEKRGFLLSAGSACSTGKAGPSHVLAAMGIGSSDAGRVLRISGGWETSEADWEALLVAILDSYEGLRDEAAGSNSQVISI